jgi:hypothetical protein
MGEINTTLNDVFKSTPLGDVKSSIAASLYGINHRNTPLPVPINRDNHGYVFFTRPQLNFTTQNLRAVRRFLPLLDQTALSLPRYIRRMLDPRLSDSEFPCPIVDSRQVFIPIMTNHILSCAGWPDPALDTFTSKPGVQREVFGLVDSVIDNYMSYDLTLTFRNMPGDPITAMIDHWMWYSSKVFLGELMPYADFLAGNEIDYNTRVWRLVMDKNKQYVQKIACCGAAEFTANPMGNSFNFESDRPRNELNDQIQTRVQCYGFCYQDPILVHEFNQSVAIFNPDMAALSTKALPSSHRRLEAHELSLFNTTGYPYIDPKTYELQWWVSNDEYDARISGFNRLAEATGLTAGE